MNTRDYARPTTHGQPIIAADVENIAALKAGNDRNTMNTVPKWIRFTRALGFLYGLFTILSFFSPIVFLGESFSKHMDDQFSYRFIMPLLFLLPWKKIRTNIIWWPLFLLSSYIVLLVAISLFIGLPFLIEEIIKKEYNALVILCLITPATAIALLQIPAFWFIKFKYAVSFKKEVRENPLNTDARRREIQASAE